MFETDRHQFSAPPPLSEEARRKLTAGRDEMMADATRPMQEAAERAGITEAKPEMSPEKRLILDAITRALAAFETCQFTNCDKCKLNSRHFGDMPICASLAGAGQAMLERGL